MDSDKKQESRDQPDDQQAQGQDSGADQNPVNTWNRLNFTQVVPQPTATQTQQGEPSTSGGQAMATDASTGAISKRRAPPKLEPAPEQAPVTEPSTIPQTKTDQPAVDTQQQTPPPTRTPSPPPLPDTSPPHSPDRQTKTEDPSTAVPYQHQLELPYGTSLESKSLLSAAWQTYRKRHGLPAEPGDRPFQTRGEADERRRKLGLFPKPEVKKPVSLSPKVQTAQPTVSSSDEETKSQKAIPDDQVSQRSVISADQGKTSPQPSDSDDDFEKISPPTSRTPSVSDLSATVPSGNVRSQLNRLKKAVSSLARRTTPKGLRKFISRATGRSPSASAGAAPADESSEGRASGRQVRTVPSPDQQQQPPPYPYRRPIRTSGLFITGTSYGEALRRNLPSRIGRENWMTDQTGFQLPRRWNPPPPPYANWNREQARQQDEWVREYFQRQKDTWNQPLNYYDLFPEFYFLEPDAGQKLTEEEIWLHIPINEFLIRRARRENENILEEVKRGEPPDYEELYPGEGSEELPSYDELFAETELLRRLGLRLNQLRFADEPDQGMDQGGQSPRDDDDTEDDEDPDQGADGGQ